MAYNRFAVKYTIGCWSLIVGNNAIVRCEVMDSRTKEYVGNFVPPNIGGVKKSAAKPKPAPQPAQQKKKPKKAKK